MTINLKLSKESITDTIKFLNNYVNEIERKMQKLSEELANIGVNVVYVHYLSGIDEGNEDYDIQVIPNEHGCTLQAKGEDVCFLEFGAGVTTAAYEGEGQEGLPPIYPGSYSRTEGNGSFDLYGYWIYGKKRYTGLEPKMGMYYASKDMQQKALEVARRVFND